MTIECRLYHQSNNYKEILDVRNEINNIDNTTLNSWHIDLNRSNKPVI